MKKFKKKGNKNEPELHIETKDLQNEYKRDSKLLKCNC